MVRVLHVAPGFKYGGIESRLVDWYSGMDRNQVHFDVVKVTPDESNPLVEKMRELGAEVYSIPPLKIKTWKQHFSEMKRIIVSGKYDVIHSHSTAYGFYPMLLGKKLGIKKRILHSRTTSYNPGEKHVLVSRCLSKMAIPLATDYFACSEEAGVWAFGRKKSVKVIRNGIMLDDFKFSQEKRYSIRHQLGIGDDETVYGYVGRFSTAKNIPFLIDVFSEVSKKNRNSKLLLVGDGPLYDELIYLCRENSIEKDVIFAGYQINVADWLNAMDVFVMPSHFEGFGTVAIEAQANGLPCVLSNGFPEVVKVLEHTVLLPLSNIDKWIETLNKYKDYKRRIDSIKIINDKGFNVLETIKFLEEFYAS